ncbi:MAG: phosphatase PAP2 family protein [Ignavibacteriota bacterium]
MKSNRIIYSLLFVLLSQTSARAQFKYDFPQFFRETGHYFTTPLSWGGDDFLILGALGAGTAVAAALEGPARDIIFQNKVLYNSVPAKIGNFYGGLYMPFILFAGYGGYSLITGDMTARKIAYEVGQACLYAGAVVTLLKVGIGRARPYANEGKSSFFNFSISDDRYHSFPSGHVTEAFAMSTVLAFNADPLWLKILAYVPAAFTPFSRAYQGYHWISDCVFGAGIGFFTAKWCEDAHGRVDDAPQKIGVLEVKSLWPFTLSMVLN